MDIDKLIRINLPEGYSYGYIGNCSFARPGTPAYFDDRAWYISKPHPGRPGERKDLVGGYYWTDDRFQLAIDLMNHLAAS